MQSACETEYYIEGDSIKIDGKDLRVYSVDNKTKQVLFLPAKEWVQKGFGIEEELNLISFDENVNELLEKEDHKKHNAIFLEFKRIYLEYKFYNLQRVPEEEKFFIDHVKNEMLAVKFYNLYRNEYCDESIICLKIKARDVKSGRICLNTDIPLVWLDNLQLRLLVEEIKNKTSINPIYILKHKNFCESIKYLINAFPNNISGSEYIKYFM